MNHNSQREKIKADLLSRHPVDSVTAFNRHHITRLSSIIKRLRDSGWPINTDQDRRNDLAHYSLPEGWRPAAPEKPSGTKKPVKSATI